MRTLRIVTATRLSVSDFWAHTLLGRSLGELERAWHGSGRRLELVARFENGGEGAEGLSSVYNRALDGCPGDRLIAFVHDDVYLHDALLLEHLEAALFHAHVVGLAGSRHSDLSQPSWGLAFTPELEPLGWQNHRGLILSGAVSHTDRLPSSRALPPPLSVSHYGPLPARCELLDGLFLACLPTALKAARARFDERFRFHHYDLDFCRTAGAQGLILSTAPILVSHASGGDFTSPEWKASARLYRDKWREEARKLGSAEAQSPLLITNEGKAQDSGLRASAPDPDPLPSESLNPEPKALSHSPQPTASDSGEPP